MLKMSSVHKISVIIPVYNVEKYIKKCLDSVINQTYGNLEIIVINDGSTDESGSICDYYSKTDDRIILVHQENQGVSKARNNGIDIASAAYIGFVDSDDWIEADMFSSLYENCIAYDADISTCSSYDVDLHGNITNSSYIDLDDRIVSNSQYLHLSKEKKYSGSKIILEGFDKIKNCNNMGAVWGKLYRKHLFSDIKFPEGKIHEDIFTNHKLIDKANRIVVSMKYGYYYVARSNSIMNSPFHVGSLDHIEACIDKYDYTSSKYPTLEKECRRDIFSALLNCMFKAYENSTIEKYKENLNEAIDKVRHYDVNNCGLHAEQENILKLLFTGGLSAYAKGIKIWQYKQN